MNNNSPEKSKNKKILIPVIIAVIAIAVLAVAFFCGGTPSDSGTDGNDLAVNYENAGVDPDNIQDGTCTISVECSTVLDNMDMLKAGKESIIPSDGNILAPVTVSFKGGDTVFDVLYDVLKENKIHFEYAESPLYNSIYIEGINNLYEFDCGELSGWMFCVNADYTGVGCSRCYVQDGDVVRFVYTCELGEDIGSVVEEK